MMRRLSDGAREVLVTTAQGGMVLSVARVNKRPSGLPRLLLLHGSPTDMDDWGALVDELERTIEIAALDLPGFGRSHWSGIRKTSVLDHSADAVQAVADALGWREPFYVAGHSHGGGVAQTLAARHGRSIAGLILIGTLGSPAHRVYRQLTLPGVREALGLLAVAMRWSVARPLMRARLRSIMAPMFEPAPLPDEEVQAQLRRLEARPTVLVEMANAAHGRPCDQLAREAPRIAAPVLFLHGEHDQIVPLAHARAIHDRLSCARSVHLQIVTGAGHMPHRTHPRQVASAINDWLKRQTASGRCSPNAATAEVRERQEGGSTTWKDW